MRAICTTALAVGLLAGCADPMTCPRVVYLDGAGWYSGDGPVREGLRRAGFTGVVERFAWSSGFGPLPDHIVSGRRHARSGALAKRITELRRANPDGQIVLMGLSAGTGIVLGGLEKLPDDVAVDHVVLLSPSVSSRWDLLKALRHVNGRLYATCSPHDGILPGVIAIGREGGKPAGLEGFQRPAIFDERRRRQYRKVINLPWRPGYLAYNWDGGHVSVTHSEFIRVVIAPRIMEDYYHPLDQPLVRLDARRAMP